MGTKDTLMDGWPVRREHRLALCKYFRRGQATACVCMVPPVYSGPFLGCLLKVKTKANAGKLGGSPGSGGLQESMRIHTCM